ncbi:MAG: glutathione binding-like protein [Pseudomonadota bacterium]
MSALTDFKITDKWPPQHPDRIQLYSLPTPNGIKASAMLEETGLAYEPHLVSFATDDQMTPEFLSLNPNNKIPAIIDPNGPDGKPIGLWESGAILIYLADKSGQLLSTEPTQRYQTLQWLMFQMGGAGPIFGQFGFFHKFAGSEIEDKRPYERYQNETKRLLAVMNGQLEKTEYISGDEYTIADIALWPWVRTLGGFYEASEELELEKFEAVNIWYNKCMERPASEKATNIPARD